MKHAIIRMLVVSAVVVAATAGCSRKEQQPAQAPAIQPGATPQQAGQPPQQKGEVKAAPQDEVDVVPVRDGVLSHYKDGDFEAVYRDASPGFREVGPKEQFVALWKQQFEQTGAIKTITETGHSIRPTDRFLIFIYRVQYEKMQKYLRLTFGRSTDGKKMELTGINQSDAQNKDK